MVLKRFRSSTEVIPAIVFVSLSQLTKFGQVNQRCSFVSNSSLLIYQTLTSILIRQCISSGRGGLQRYMLTARTRTRTTLTVRKEYGIMYLCGRSPKIRHSLDLIREKMGNFILNVEIVSNSLTERKGEINCLYVALVVGGVFKVGLPPAL